MITAGDLIYTCADCEYSGHRIATVTTRHMSEAWGVKRVEVERVPLCPQCGSERVDCQPAVIPLGGD